MSSLLSWARSTSSVSQHKSEVEDSASPLQLGTTAPLPAAATPLVPTRTPSRRSRRSQRTIGSPLKGAAILLAFLPLPPLVSVLHVVCGHAILRAAHHRAFAFVPLAASARAAAAGGAILAFPLALLLFYLLFFPTRPPEPEDFFDDDDSTSGAGAALHAALQTYGFYGACAVLGVVVGALAGPLGVICLSDRGRALSTGQAAAAGIVGGVVLCGALGVAGSIVVAFYYFVVVLWFVIVMCWVKA
ncbi:hypothetical protein C8J57DRAFT_1225523 [Mycena rebaudengoi]|nr:hypothetical protein C8J57DRAFT_1225523 [Mycena rebaudengoi]